LCHLPIYNSFKPLLLQREILLPFYFLQKTYERDLMSLHRRETNSNRKGAQRDVRSGKQKQGDKNGVGSVRRAVYRTLVKLLLFTTIAEWTRLCARIPLEFDRGNSTGCSRKRAFENGNRNFLPREAVVVGEATHGADTRVRGGGRSGAGVRPDRVACAHRLLTNLGRASASFGRDRPRRP